MNLKASRGRKEEKKREKEERGRARCEGDKEKGRKEERRRKEGADARRGPGSNKEIQARWTDPGAELVNGLTDVFGILKEIEKVM